MDQPELAEHGDLESADCRKHAKPVVAVLAILKGRWHREGYRPEFPGPITFNWLL
jgi:hypothetical protein